MLNEKLTQYMRLEEEIHEYFGYVEDWVKIPLADMTDVWWRINSKEGGGELQWAETPWDTETEEPEYVEEIYTQRFLPRWVYRKEDYTMVCVDTQTDGNKFLYILDNEMEIK